MKKKSGFCEMVRRNKRTRVPLVGGKRLGMYSILFLDVMCLTASPNFCAYRFFLKIRFGSNQRNFPIYRDIHNLQTHAKSRAYFKPASKTLQQFQTIKKLEN